MFSENKTFRSLRPDFMENWRPQEEDSTSTSDIFPPPLSHPPLSHLPQVYPQSPSIHDRFSSHTLQIPQILHHPVPVQEYIRQQTAQSSLSRIQNMTLEETMALIAMGQSLIVDSMTKLSAKLEDSSPRTQMVNDLAAGIGGINLDRAAPPHQSFAPQHQNQRDRPSYAPTPQANFRSDSPSEGAYARDTSRPGGLFREPRIRENLRFTGE